MKKTMRQMQKEQTKERLLETACQLFSKQGILNTRVADVAQAAGVSHGTIFLHFETQERLVTEVVERYCGGMAARLHELTCSCGDVREFLSAHLEGIMEFEPFYTRLVIENRFLPLGARDAWITVQSAISYHFSQMVEREISLVRTDVPLSVLFNTWMGLIHYYLENGDLFAPGESVIHRYKNVLCGNYLKMITTERMKHDAKSI
ncbi:MAG: transcriptional regulator [Oscillospiraceae bacterium]|nr:transcriptional regulator [Oscillospiraceae bacterium]